ADWSEPHADCWPHSRSLPPGSRRRRCCRCHRNNQPLRSCSYRSWCSWPGPSTESLQRCWLRCGPSHFLQKSECPRSTLPCQATPESNLSFRAKGTKTKSDATNGDAIGRSQRTVVVRDLEQVARRSSDRDAVRRRRTLPDDATTL